MRKSIATYIKEVFLNKDVQKKMDYSTSEYDTIIIHVSNNVLKTRIAQPYNSDLKSIKELIGAYGNEDFRGVAFDKANRQIDIFAGDDYISSDERTIVSQLDIKGEPFWASLKTNTLNLFFPGDEEGLAHLLVRYSQLGYNQIKEYIQYSYCSNILMGIMNM